MRYVLLLALFASSFMILNSAKAQSWNYNEELDPFTDEVKDVLVSVEQPEGGISVLCLEDIGLVVATLFGIAAEELDPPEESGTADGEEPPPTVTVKWRVNKGEILEFTTPIFDGHGYGVEVPFSVELAKMLVNAREFATTNGGEGPSERILHFRDLEGGKQIERVLEACGY